MSNEIGEGLEFDALHSSAMMLWQGRTVTMDNWRNSEVIVGVDDRCASAAIVAGKNVTLADLARKKWQEVWQVDEATRLAILKQAFDDLLAIGEPETVAHWQPDDPRRSRYLSILYRVLPAVEAVESAAKAALLQEGEPHRYTPGPLLEFYRQEVVPRLRHLDLALKTLDPVGYDTWALTTYISWAGGKTREIFELAISRVEDLIENEGDPEYHLSELAARDLLKSKLINFDPDGWLERAQGLTPVRTTRKGVDLPVHVHRRLVELYRVYIFACWIAVFGLARAILEYTLLDNLHKFGIERWLPQGDPTRGRRAKSLEVLIDEVGGHIDGADDMNRIRELGNKYLHPAKDNKASLFDSQSQALEVVTTLVSVVERVYAAQRVEGKQ